MDITIKHSQTITTALSPPGNCQRLMTQAKTQVSRANYRLSNNRYRTALRKGEQGGRSSTSERIYLLNNCRSIVISSTGLSLNSTIRPLVDGLEMSTKNSSKVSPIFKIFFEILIYIIALSLFGRDWKKVEKYIGTRSGAQIRSHA